MKIFMENELEGLGLEGPGIKKPAAAVNQIIDVWFHYLLDIGLIYGRLDRIGRCRGNDLINQTVVAGSIHREMKLIECGSRLMLTRSLPLILMCGDGFERRRRIIKNRWKRTTQRFWLEQKPKSHRRRGNFSLVPQQKQHKKWEKEWKSVMKRESKLYIYIYVCVYL